MKQVAHCAGIKESTFLSYVDARERIPPADVAVKIADILGVSVEYLVNGPECRTCKKFSDIEKNEAILFYQKYRQYNLMLQSLDALPDARKNEAKSAICMLLYGYLHS